MENRKLSAQDLRNVAYFLDVSITQFVNLVIDTGFESTEKARDLMVELRAIGRVRNECLKLAKSTEVKTG